MKIQNTKAYKQAEEEINKVLKDKDFSDFEKDTIREAYCYIAATYDPNNNNPHIDREQILKNIDNITIITCKDMSDQGGTMGYIKTDGIDLFGNPKTAIVYTDDTNRMKEVLMHETIHCLGYKDFSFDKGLTTGVIDVEKDKNGQKERDLVMINEIGTQEFTKNALKELGYSVEEIEHKYVDYTNDRTIRYVAESAGYSSVSPYADIIFQLEGQKFANSYFGEENNYDGDKFKELNKKIENVWNADFQHRNDNIEDLNKAFLGYVTESYKFQHMNESQYNDLIKEIKELPDMKREDIMFLDYMRHYGKDLDIRDIVPMNENLKDSLMITGVIRDYLPEISEKGYNTNDIKFETIEKEEGIKQVVFSLDDKQYSFFTNGLTYGGLKENNDVIELTQKMFDEKQFGQYKDAPKASDFDFKDLIYLNDKTNWMEHIKNNFSREDQKLIDAAMNDGINGFHINKYQDFHDAAGNNILHIAAYSNDDISGLDRFSMIAVKDKTMEKLLLENNNDGLTAFQVAVKQDNYEVALYLSNKVDKLGIENLSGENKLNYDNISCLKWSLDNEEYGLTSHILKSLDYSDEKSKEAISLVIEDGKENPDILNALMRLDLKDMDDGLKSDLVSEAIVNKNYKMAEALMDNDTVKDNPLDKDNEHLKEFLYAATEKDNDVSGNKITEFISEKFEDRQESQFFAYMIEKGYDVNKEFTSEYEPGAKISAMQIAMAIDNSNGTPDYSLIGQLADAGASINEGNEKFPPPLQYAHETGDVKFFETMMEHGYTKEQLFEGYENTTKLSEKQIEHLEEVSEKIENQQNSIFYKIYEKIKDKDDKELDGDAAVIPDDKGASNDALQKTIEAYEDMDLDM